jgi:ADP-ribosyl-[dinitrogen reductase] hydrolase
VKGSENTPQQASTERPGSTRDRTVGALVGLAAGDAVGTAVEFRPRGSFPP